MLMFSLCYINLIGYILWILQAAKEFESELKKEPESTQEPSPETPKAVSEQEKQDTVPSSKENAWHL